MQWFLQDIHIGDNLHRLRKQKGLTQAEIVAQLQIRGSAMSRATYSKIETGARNLRVSDLILLHVILDADYAEFFTGLTPPGG